MNKEEQLDKVFYALSDQTRRKMLMELTRSELQINELGGPFGMSKQAISKHVKVLESAGLVKKQKDGRIQKCSFNIEKLEQTQAVLDMYKKHWERQFDQLETYIEKMKAKEKKK